MRRVGLLCVLCVLCGASLSAQRLSGEPLTLIGGRLTVGGDATIAVAQHDEGYFNRSDYDHDVTRMLRLGLTAAFRPHPRITIVSDVRTENADWLRPYALYVKIAPWLERGFDLRIGRIPPAFGAFARRNYASDNPLIGTPLAYQYLTSIRPDAVPVSADDLLRMRGRGWFAGYTLGNTAFAAGSPLVSALRWDTGIEARLTRRHVEVAGAVTTGTLSNPRLRDDNDGRQFAGRIAFKPSPAVTMGASAARGPFLTNGVVAAIPRDTIALTRVITTPVPEDPYGGGSYGSSYGSTTTTTELTVVQQSRKSYTQQAFGFDAEFSNGYWLVRTETILSRWYLPAILSPYVSPSVSALSFDLEGRYKIWPGVFVAGRFDHLRFSRVLGSAGWQSWDAPVTRVEAGTGVYVRRNVVWKVVYQGNWRDGGRVRRYQTAATQLLFWF